MYLLIENRVKEMPSVELIRMLGASASRGESTKIGQFGSGFPNTLALFARTMVETGRSLLSTVKLCLGTDVYTFETTPHNVTDSAGRKSVQHEIRMRKQGGASWDLNISTKFGEIDWTDETMGIREILSNAIDGADSFDGTTSSVRVDADIPDNSRALRAKDGLIRFYVYLTPEIADYIAQRHSHFICLLPTYKPDVRVVPNHTSGPANIYRKGVRVGSFGNTSLFHYNIPDIKVDESRNVDSYTARYAACRALLEHGTPDQIETYYRTCIFGEHDVDCWEADFDPCYLSPRQLWHLSETQRHEIQSRWEAAALKIVGNAVLCENETTRKMVEGKGRQVIKVRESKYNEIVRAAKVKTADDILNHDELGGRIRSEATPDMVAALDSVWNALQTFRMTLNKPKPPIAQYEQHTRTEGASDGLWDGTTILVRSDCRTDLYHVILHECGHYITGDTDYTPTFQEFFVKFAARMIKESALQPS